MRHVVAGTIGLVIAVAMPGAAAAKTLQVDDNRAKCRSAAFTSIQPAVDAAASGDVIRVCPGIYTGPIVLPEGKDNLQLRAVASLQATLRQPAGGIPSGTFEPDFDVNPTAIVITRGRNTLVRGFRIVGPTSYADPDSCGGSDGRSAVAVAEGSATIDSNHITSASLTCPSETPFGPFGRAVFSGDREGSFNQSILPIKVKVDRNRIDGRSGIASDDGIVRYTVQRNTMTGTGAGNSFGFSHGEDSPGPNPGFTHVIRANQISGYQGGVQVFDGSRPLVTGNWLSGNDAGIVIGESSGGDLRGNSIRDGGTGIVLGQFGGTTSSYIVRDNQVRDNSGDGIRAGAASTRNQLLNNRSLGNAGLDCRDQSTGAKTAGTANLWTRNIGVTDSPEVCRAP